MTGSGWMNGVISGSGSRTKLVLDWRRRASALASVKTTIKGVLDQTLPVDPYPPELFDEKVDAIFNHIVASYGDEGRSVYDGAPVEPAPASGSTVAVLEQTQFDTLTEEAVERLRRDADFASAVAAKLGLPMIGALRSIDYLIDNDEDFAVEFKSTARWDLREDKPNKAMEDAIVKTVAGFLNTDGGTLLIGVGPDLQTVGLDHDYPKVKPPNADGFVNWLTTHLINALGPVPVTRTRARITVREGKEICRVDVAASPEGVWAKTSKQPSVFFVRMNNSTRAMPEDEVDAYLKLRQP